MQDKSQKDIILQYSGPLNYDVIGELIGSLKEKMRQKQVRFTLYKKILTLMIEALENIIRYRSHVGRKQKLIDNYPPEFSIKTDSENVYLTTVNAILHKDIRALNDRLTKLIKLDLRELKELYKETITNGKFSEKGGAGLGIIEMAKIADEKIQYSFVSINDQVSYFHLCLVIKKTLPVEEV